MCLIVDNNVAHKVFGSKPDPEFAPIREALFGRFQHVAAIVHYSNALLREYAASPAHLRTLLELSRAGRAFKLPEADVVREFKRIVKSGACVSDDQHIIAIARVGGARLLCSHDRNLHCDFTNVALVPTPQGKIYQDASHAHLLRQCCQGASR
jgi:hypothetical protein